MRRWQRILTVIACVSFAGSVHAQGLDRQKEALTAIRDFANSMCTTPPLEQRSQNLELNGAAKAKLAGLIGKVADLGVQGAAKYKSESSQGVLQGELAAAIKDGNNCRLSVFNKLVDKMVPVQAPTSPSKKLPTRFEKPEGYFLREGNAWIEYPPYAPNQNFMFRSMGADSNFVYLVDRSRTKQGDANNAMLVRLPIEGGAAQWTYQNPLNWVDFTVVTPAP